MKRLHSISVWIFPVWRNSLLKGSPFCSWTIESFLCTELESASLKLGQTFPNPETSTQFYSHLRQKTAVPLSLGHSSSNSSSFKAFVLSSFLQAKHLWLTELFSKGRCSGGPSEFWLFLGSSIICYGFLRYGHQHSF